MSRSRSLPRSHDVARPRPRPTMTPHPPPPPRSAFTRPRLPRKRLSSFLDPETSAPNPAQTMIHKHQRTPEPTERRPMSPEPEPTANPVRRQESEDSYYSSDEDDMWETRPQQLIYNIYNNVYNDDSRDYSSYDPRQDRGRTVRAEGAGFSEHERGPSTMTRDESFREPEPNLRREADRTGIGKARAQREQNEFIREREPVVHDDNDGNRHVRRDRDPSPVYV